jgi:hypothetical protein
MGSWRSICGGLLAAVPLVACGCGKSRVPDRVPVVPVRGTVLYEGKAAVGAVVSFHPASSADPRALRSNGKVREDGTFALSTYLTDDGAPEGTYIVTVYWADPSWHASADEDEQTDVAPDRFKGRFATREASLLRAKVGTEPVEFAPFDLASGELAAGEYHLQTK